jgi:hypothetical protein
VTLAPSLQDTAVELKKNYSQANPHDLVKTCGKVRFIWGKPGERKTDVKKF